MQRRESPIRKRSRQTTSKSPSTAWTDTGPALLTEQGGAAHGLILLNSPDELRSSSRQPDLCLTRHRSRGRKFPVDQSKGHLGWSS